MAGRKGNMPWYRAVRLVLEKAGHAMHYTEIAEAISEQKLRQDMGATPAATVNANVSWSIKYEPDKTPFQRTGKGMYAIRPGAPPSPPAGVVPPDEPAPPADAPEVPEESAGIIQAFGMFWRRNLVDWVGTPELFGVQQPGATRVNFSDQRGVYLLHDVQRVVYVGQAALQGLGTRLCQHTYNRLNGRWDRFSWFGIRKVMPDGQLSDLDFSKVTAEDIITTLEAVLIEGLEPPQNRRRGDEFQAVEYLQVESEKRKAKAAKAQLADLIAKLGNP